MGNRRKPQQEHLVNENIPFSKIFVINSDNTQIGVLSKNDAIAKAKEQKMDLVIISIDNSSDKPKPIGRIMDYGKFKYERKKKQKEVKEKQTFVNNREIRLTLGINVKDIQTKAKKAREFLLDGDRVKVSLKFRGREASRPELGKEVLDKFFKYVEDIAKITKDAQQNERFLDMYLERDKKKSPHLTSSKKEKELQKEEKGRLENAKNED
ncbi:translation initiation factor IF-3 [Mesomycoplasma lagogenitalium]|uniref:Translation initiation factor IF-3 n=1 Tax=Mesomycoplasma lagogenitalium TaxID=171286 RepID=A0ABY8LW87_9BACT|nr:translation initiation factor IF-3 [Mesomycoplasma lagogenitalium]WGI36558.1 translation initiation factor IF-3 [Mesomycoplasma lagogenitalium]